MRNLLRKGGETMPAKIIEQRTREAVELLKKGGLSANIALRFLKQHAAA